MGQGLISMQLSKEECAANLASLDAAGSIAFDAAIGLEEIKIWVALQSQQTTLQHQLDFQQSILNPQTLTLNGANLAVFAQAIRGGAAPGGLPPMVPRDAGGRPPVPPANPSM